MAKGFRRREQDPSGERAAGLSRTRLTASCPTSWPMMPARGLVGDDAPDERSLDGQDRRGRARPPRRSARSRSVRTELPKESPGRAAYSSLLSRTKTEPFDLPPRHPRKRGRRVRA
ncbi:MAG: hypothetical protein MZV63_41260 [Marinilabiliales bacterium]|nr:hypothetical protein [Marinilabiliales bacterium]